MENAKDEKAFVCAAYISHKHLEIPIATEYNRIIEIPLSVPINDNESNGICLYCI